MLLGVYSSIVARNKRHKDDADFTKVDEHFKDHPYYICAAFKGELPTLKKLHDPDEGIMMNRRKRRNTKFIFPEENISSVPGYPISTSAVQKLSTNIHNHTEWKERSKSEKCQWSHIIKKVLQNLHERVQTMILNASATTNQVMPAALCISCEDLFKKPNLGKALQLMNTTINDNYNWFSDIQEVAVTAVLRGCFMCDHDDTQSTFIYLTSQRNNPKYRIRRRRKWYLNWRSCRDEDGQATTSRYPWSKASPSQTKRKTLATRSRTTKALTPVSSVITWWWKNILQISATHDDTPVSLLSSRNEIPRVHLPM